MPSQIEYVPLKIRGGPSPLSEQHDIDKAKTELAGLHQIGINEIGHCIDGTTHEKFGHNKRFVALRDISYDRVYLARVTRAGRPSVVTGKYLASYLYRRLRGKNRYLHFYLKR